MPASSNPAFAELRVLIPQPLYTEIRLVAQAQHRNLSDWVRMTLEHALKPNPMGLSEASVARDAAIRREHPELFDPETLERKAREATQREKQSKRRKPKSSPNPTTA